MLFHRWTAAFRKGGGRKGKRVKRQGNAESAGPEDILQDFMPEEAVKYLEKKACAEGGERDEKRDENSRIR